MKLLESDGISYILKDCALCDGEGILLKKAEDDDESNTYKDSFEKQADGQNYRTVTCVLCKGLTVVLIELKNIVILRRDEASDKTPEQPEPS